MAAGVYTCDELLRCLPGRHEDPGCESAFDHLIDLRDVSEFRPDAPEIRRRADEGQAAAPRPEAGRVAIVSSHDVVFGMMRIYESLMAGAPSEVRTFRDMEDATAWLGLPRDIVES